MDFLVSICILSQFLVVSLQLISNVRADPNTFNVQDYGAVGDGKSDDSSAFQKAWDATCSATGVSATMVIPQKKTFLVYPITFSGPCKSTTVNVELSGIVKAPDNPSAWTNKDEEKGWLSFNGIKGLNINGFGQIDGSGQKWWEISCKLNPGKEDCNHAAPFALKLIKCDNVHMDNIAVINSPQVHIVVYDTRNVFLKSLTVTAPRTSPNTDGINIAFSDNVWIEDSIFETGDDCVAIEDRSTNINISHCKCGPGHGVSIGSLGKNGEEVFVENITVNHVQFTETTNGGRIKSWQNGRGQARNIEFSDLNFTLVDYPIIIDQYYCDSKTPCPPTNTGVKISDVRYLRAYGISTTQVAINLNCSNNVPCTGITFQDVQLTGASKAGSGNQVISICNNAFGVTKGVVEPKSCLK